jgi:hypothetical protein
MYCSYVLQIVLVEEQNKLLSASLTPGLRPRLIYAPVCSRSKDTQRTSKHQYLINTRESQVLTIHSRSQLATLQTPSLSPPQLPTLPLILFFFYLLLYIQPNPPSPLKSARSEVGVSTRLRIPIRSSWRGCCEYTTTDTQGCLS